MVRHGIDTAMGELFKATPGIVSAYDPVTNTAFVRPAVKRAGYSTSTDERSYREVGEIPFVPVLFPRAGGFVLRTPVSAGDSVLLVFCDESLAEWRESGGVSEPEDARRHSVGWPVAIPGFFPDSKPPSPLDGAAAALQAIFGQDGGKQVRVGPTGIEFAPAGVTPISPVALAVPTDAALATIIPAINAIIASLNALITKYNGHTHLYAPGPGTPIATATTTDSATSAAAGPALPATTASLLVRSM